MRQPIDRRRLLTSCLGGVALAALSSPLQKVLAQSLAAPLTVRGKLSLINAGGSNVLVCETSAGLVLVDSGTADYSQRLLDTLAGIRAGNVHTMFNTHWHADQCGANTAIGTSGAAIIAHQKTWHHLSTRYYLPPENRYFDALPEAGRPTVRFHDKGSVNIGGETVDYGALVEAHTDGDIYIHFRDDNVLAAGGAVASDLDPELDWYGGGWLGGRAQSLDTLVALADDDTLIIPAKGQIMTRADLVAERDMTHALYQRLNDLIRSGCSAQCMEQEGALEGLGRTWQDPQRFLYAAYKGLWAHHYNLAPDIL